MVSIPAIDYRAQLRIAMAIAFAMCSLEFWLRQPYWLRKRHFLPLQEKTQTL
jgi:hypothetical protein